MSGSLYAYALVEPTRPPLPPVEGVCPGPLALVADGPVAAVVGPVEVSQFEEPALERNLAEPGWLENVVRAHERVVEALMVEAPVLPMRFGSIFSDRAALAAMLADNEPDLVALLERLRGRVELGVTARVHADGLMRVAAPVPADASDGRAYLRRRGSELRAAEDVAAAAAALASELHDVLSAAAERAEVLSSRRSDPGLVLSAAYLVPVGGIEEFCRQVDVVRSANREACSLDVTGPWPPYSFTSVDVSGPRS